MPTNSATVKAKSGKSAKSSAKIATSEPAEQWSARFDLDYRTAVWREQDKRAVARHRASLRRHKAAKFSPSEMTFAEWEAQAAASEAREKAVARHARNARLVRDRAQIGYIHRGGPVGGNLGYSKKCFVYKGLRSEEALLLRLFVTKLPRAKRLHVGDDKTQWTSTDSKLLALDSCYVGANSSVCGVLRVELDAELTAEEIGFACSRVGCPAPNLIVGYRSRTGAFVNPHALWLLRESIPLEGPRFKGNAALYRGVMRGLTAALLCVGADPGGLSNLHRHKNPLSPLWEIQILAASPLTLTDLKASVDTTIRPSELERRWQELAAGRAAKSRGADHPDGAVASQSNRVFRELAAWARGQVVAAKKAGMGEMAFGALVERQAYAIAAEECGHNDMRRAEDALLRTVRSVTHWTWNVYTPRTVRERLPAAVVRASCTYTSGLAADARRESASRTRLQVIAAVRTLADRGAKIRQAAVIDMLAAQGVAVSERTVSRHWAEAKASLTAPVVEIDAPAEVTPAPAPAPALVPVEAKAPVLLTRDQFLAERMRRATRRHRAIEACKIEGLACARATSRRHREQVSSGHDFPVARVATRDHAGVMDAPSMLRPADQDAHDAEDEIEKIEIHMSAFGEGSSAAAA